MNESNKNKNAMFAPVQYTPNTLPFDVLLDLVSRNQLIVPLFLLEQYTKEVMEGFYMRGQVFDNDNNVNDLGLG